MIMSRPRKMSFAYASVQTQSCWTSRRLGDIIPRFREWSIISNALQPNSPKLIFRTTLGLHWLGSLPFPSVFFRVCFVPGHRLTSS